MKNNQKGIISSSSVDEEMRIRFTSQLHQLRESEVKEVIFPSNLNNIERKFLHKLAQDLGLKSKSKGKGEERYITVTKGNGLKDNNMIFQLQSSTISVLSNYLYSKLHITTSQIRKRTSLQDNFNHKNNNNSKSLSTEFYIHKQNLRIHNPKYQSLQNNREKLPAFSHKDMVIDLVKNHDIMLISGETGCGKTTQVPQFIFDDPEIGPSAKIAVTQPRRLSAISVSERIATERSESLGDVVGYNIRFESEYNENTRIHFMTPGVLLRIMQNDPLLSEWTHIIIDEAHERDRYTEFLFIILRDLISNSSIVRKPKLILMSATLHIEKLSNYFGDIPQVHIGSSRYSVEEFYLEHILKFVGYSDSLLGNNRNNATNSNNTNSNSNNNVSTPSKSKKSFICPICNSTNRIFYSSAELGTHVALCDGTDITTPITSTNIATSKNNNQKKSNNKKSNKSSLSNKITSLQDNNYEHYEAEIQLESQLDNLPEIEDNDEPEEPDEMLITEDPMIVSDIIGESSFSRIATRFLSHNDDDLIKRYQQSWDDSLVDIDLIYSLIKYIFQSEFSRDHGVVLVFLPGWDDISRLRSLLLTDEKFRNYSKFRILPLHSGISKQSQREIFLPVPSGVYKIVLSTNIAETSVTIDNVTVVIDSGRSKEKSYDPHTKLSSLKENWISQSSANQRRGRAGRTRAGVCFRLYSIRRYEALSNHQESELVRTSLEELVLTTKLMNLAPGQSHESNGVPVFLSKAMDPPHSLSIVNAITNLKTIKCLNHLNESITILGRTLSQLPIDPFLGRALIFSSLFGVLPSMIRMTCIISYRDPFIIPTDDKQKSLSKKIKLNLSQGLSSDQIVIYYALAQYEKMIKHGSNHNDLQEFCDNNFLSKTTLHYLLELEKQLQRSLESLTGISTRNNFTFRNERNDQKHLPLLCSLIGIGLFSNVAIRKSCNTNFMTEKGCKAKVHPSSINRKQGQELNNSKSHNSNNNQNNQLEMIAYQELITASASTMTTPGGAHLLMISTTPVNVYTYLLFCGNIELLPSITEEISDNEDNIESDSNIKNDMCQILVDNWLNLSISTQSYDLINLSRNNLEEILNTYLESPNQQLSTHQLTIINAITDAIAYESLDSLISKQKNNNDKKVSNQEIKGDREDLEQKNDKQNVSNGKNNNNNKHQKHNPRINSQKNNLKDSNK